MSDLPARESMEFDVVIAPRRPSVNSVQSAVKGAN